MCVSVAYHCKQTLPPPHRPPPPRPQTRRPETTSYCFLLGSGELWWDVHLRTGSAGRLILGSQALAVGWWLGLESPQAWMSKMAHVCGHHKGDWLGLWTGRGSGSKGRCVPKESITRSSGGSWLLNRPQENRNIPCSAFYWSKQSVASSDSRGGA